MYQDKDIPIYSKVACNPPSSVCDRPSPANMMIESLYTITKELDDLKIMMEEKFDSLHIPSTGVVNSCGDKVAPTRSRFFEATFNEIDTIREKISYIKGFVNNLEF